MLTACSSKDDDNGINGPETEELTPPVRIEMTTAQSEAVDNSSEFSMALFRNMCDAAGGENTVMSPLGSALSLGMIANGDDGQSRDEITGLMLKNAGTNGIDALNTIYASITSTLPQTDKNTKIIFANSAWYVKGITPAAAFTQAINRYYSAEAMTCAPEESAAKINSWVSGKTEGLIKDIADSENPLEGVALINTLYFKSVWNKAFDKKLTRKEQFSGGGQVEMMYKKGGFAYGECDEFKMLTDYFGNKAFSISYILPKGSMESVTDGISMAKIKEVKASGNNISGTLAVPKFKIAATTELMDALMASGISKIFNREAGLNGIAEGATLYVSKIAQAISFEVNEDGAEGASATKADMIIGVAPGQTFEFKLDRPFIFMVQETSTGAVLFMGRIMSL